MPNNYYLNYVLQYIIQCVCVVDNLWKLVLKIKSYKYLGYT